MNPAMIKISMGALIEFAGLRALFGLHLGFPTLRSAQMHGKIASHQNQRRAPSDGFAFTNSAITGLVWRRQVQLRATP